MKIRVITTSKLSQEQFGSESLIARSLNILPNDNIELCAYTNNSIGLSELYNKEILAAKSDPKILVFVHDDVIFLDYNWANKIRNSLQTYDIVGVAGSKRRVQGQPSWAFKGVEDKKLVWEDDEFLSGAVAHDSSWPSKKITYYGPSNQKVVQLDGVLLACNSEKLNQNNILFDESFDFHFYDLDFCRVCDDKGLSLGVIDLPICHAGKGNMATEQFQKMYNIYTNKWKTV